MAVGSLRAEFCSLAIIATSVLTTPAAAQESPDPSHLDLLLSAGLAGNYPAFTLPDCDEHVGYGVGGGVRWRPLRHALLEATLGALLPHQVPFVTDCGFSLLEPEPGFSVTERRYRAGLDDAAVLAQVRAVLAPELDDAVPFRVLLGAGWLGRKVPHALIGAGLGGRFRWGSLSVDVERYFMSVPYDDVRTEFHGQGPVTRTTVASAREVLRSWGLRMGLGLRIR